MSLSALISLLTKNVGRAFGIIAVLFSVCAAVWADIPSTNLAKVFPADVGGFHQVEPVGQTTQPDKNAPQIKSSFFDSFKSPQPLLIGSAEYASPNGEKLIVELTRWENDSAAYAMLTRYRRYVSGSALLPNAQVGTASSLASPQTVAFFKGSAFVIVKTQNGQNADQVKTFARAFADTLDAGDGDIPVLVKHLPNWETVQAGGDYAVTSETLLAAVPNQPVLKEVSFEGGTEAVIANYGQSQLVIVEFTTPQFSVENDQRIWTKIGELKSQGQPTPIAYRRVGNYSVFVFNAPDEKTANALVDQVRYEQIVQWLGEDPHMADRLQRYFQRTTSGVLIAVLKSSGLSLLICLGVGALFGGLLFRHRRAQYATLYSDAGGGTRLNLDELTGANMSQRLLGRGEQTESDS
jgi:hypothetical protein